MKRLSSQLGWAALSVFGAASLAYVALKRGESINAVWIVAAAVCVYLIAYRFYSHFIANRVLRLDAQAADSRLQIQRRPRLRADQQLRAVRPPFRRDRRRRAAGRAGAGRADGLPAGHAVDPGRRRVRRRGAGLHGAVHLDAARRPLAGRPDQIRTGRDPRPDRPARHLHDHGHHPGGAGADRRQGADRLAVGQLHRDGHHPDRAVHGRVFALHPGRPHRRNFADRLRAADAGHRRRPVRARLGHAGPDVHLHRPATDLDADRLRLRRLGDSGLAAAGAARLPVHLPQDRHHRRPGDRHRASSRRT